MVQIYILQGWIIARFQVELQHATRNGSETKINTKLTQQCIENNNKSEIVLQMIKNLGAHGFKCINHCKSVDSVSFCQVFTLSL